jgi:hypothetical protein
MKLACEYQSTPDTLILFQYQDHIQFAMSNWMT